MIAEMLNWSGPSIFSPTERRHQLRVSRDELKRDTKKRHNELIGICSALLDLEGGIFHRNRDGRIAAPSLFRASHVAQRCLKAEFPKTMHPERQREWQNMALMFFDLAGELGYVNL
ncbi:MAG TPA: hypothetical protein VFG51_00340 [Candidatus Saccharimonadia bacterium]|nr:hypothetical protein [Candidatus Saccharimonadia bacterium]